MATKESGSGKSYAAAIASNPLRNSKQRGLKAEAFNAYKLSMKKDLEEGKPLRDKKLEEAQKELEATKDARAAAKKEHKLAKNTKRREKQATAKALLVEQAKKAQDEAEKAKAEKAVEAQTKAEQAVVGQAKAEEKVVEQAPAVEPPKTEEKAVESAPAVELPKAEPLPLKPAKA
jgi:hypothetical protein